MKTSIIIKEGRVQLVLSPETKHEKEVLKVLEQLPQTYRVNFFDTRGGFVHCDIAGDTLYGHEKSGYTDLLMVFDKPKEDTDASQETDQMQPHSRPPFAPGVTEEVRENMTDKFKSLGMMRVTINSNNKFCQRRNKDFQKKQKTKQATLQNVKKSSKN